jgi:hypothetical protein
LDEIDVVQDEKALKESAMIPSIKDGIFPITLMLSTRKFAGGLMEKFVNETPKMGGEVLRWNILDVCARITKEEARVGEPKVKRYIARHLPLSNISPEEHGLLNDTDKLKYEEFWAYAGIAEHELLPVMKNYLVDRNQDDHGNLYKPVPAVFNNFKSTTPDMGEAQLLCNQPSSIGLVYSSFQPHLNTLTVQAAMAELSGDPIEMYENATLESLVDYMHTLGIEFYGGADWGSTDETSLVVGAKLPSGKFWLIDLISSPGLEIPEIVKYMKSLTETYKIQRWYCDSAYPAYIKLVKKEGIPAIGVKKGPESVMDGIVAVRSKILTSNNVRSFKVIRTTSTERVVECFGTYKWKLDGKGDPIDGKPDHGKDGVSDILDAIRYLVFSLYGKTGSGVKFSYELEDEANRKSVSNNESIIRTKIQELTGGVTQQTTDRPKKKGVLWDI